MKKFISKNQKQTNEIAKEFVKTLKTGDIVLLQGDLGAGKTTFVKGIVSALHGNPDDVTSPTFTILNEYDLPQYPIYHFDLYRLSNPNELYNIGYEEYFYGDGVCFIEWPERAEEFFDKNVKIVQINKLGESQREIVFQGENE